VTGAGASSVRIAWWCALVLCVASLFAQAEPPKDTSAAPEPVDPQRLQRIEALVDIAQFPKIYDTTMLSVADPASDDPATRLIADTMRLVIWSRSRDGWLPLMARTIPDDVLGRAEAFYASDAGRALVACIREAEGQAAIRACASIPEVGDTDVADYVSGDFLRPQASDDTISAVFGSTFCGALARDRSVLERIAAACEKDASPKACSAFTRHEGRVEVDRDHCVHSF
jgi:hypothetical protein